MTESFVYALADGDCDKAIDLTTANATEIVQGSIDAGCKRYSTSIKSVYCTEKDNAAECECVEVRDGMELTFTYTLEKVGKNWKVANYAKDLEEESENAESACETACEGGEHDAACDE